MDEKKAPKVTVEQAVKALEADVNALLAEHFTAAELPSDDIKSKKNIFRALVALAATYLKTAQGVTDPASLSRNALKGILLAFPELKS